MVQPIMASLLGLGFPIQAANDPDSEMAFAAAVHALPPQRLYNESVGTVFLRRRWWRIWPWRARSRQAATACAI